MFRLSASQSVFYGSAFALALALVTGACGQNNVASPAILGSGGYGVGAGTCGVGFYVDTASRKCTADIVGFGRFSNIGGGFVPLLNAKFPATYQSNSWHTGVYVRNGDQVSFSGRGSWGTAQLDRHSFLFGLIHYYTNDVSCNSVSIEGKVKNRVMDNGGLPAGLIASDGVNYYALGKTANFTIQGLPSGQQNQLVVGINAPTDSSSYDRVYGVCAQMTINMFRVIRP